MPSKVICICTVLLLVLLAIDLARDMPTMTAATWHQERQGCQLARGERLKHVAGPALGLRDHFDAGQGNRLVQVVRNRSADQHVDPVWSQNSAVPEWRPRFAVKPPLELPTGCSSAQRRRRFAAMIRSDLGELSGKCGSGAHRSRPSHRRAPLPLPKVLDDVLLLPVQPSCQRHRQNLPHMRYHSDDSTVSKYCATGRTHCLGPSCKPFLKQDLPSG